MKKENQSLKDIVSKNIRAARIEAGLTQLEVAKKTGFKVSYVARLETPQNISLETLETIALAFNKSPEQLLNPGQKLVATKTGKNIFNDAMEKLRSVEAIINSKR